MAIACKICIATKGLRGSDIASLPKTEEELFAHLEAVHHIIVERPGETEEQSRQRFYREHPEAVNCAECDSA